ncbi:VIT1/CCC1 family protein [Thermoplasma sp.]|uniref:VIT1/CCC1 transporter family protein n=1 Tax=Thermoplasma sp. TaxID=1973142 RepID=UPI00262BBB7D|nr:VIT1/CCC1 family protein [Thermoplasma sp.]
MDSDVKQWSEFYRDELTDMTFYSVLSRKIKDDYLRENLAKLSSIEKEHSDFWKQNLEKAGVKPEPRYNKLKVSFLVFMRHFLGLFLTARLLEHGEISTVRVYSEYLKRPGLEENFRRRLQEILDEEIEHEEIFEKAMEKSSDTIERNKDMIYGISDGLVEVLAALAGLTSIIVSNIDIALGGLVVGISGTASMSIGAYLSKKSETEYKLVEEEKKILFRRQKVDHDYIKTIKGESKTSAIYVGISYIIGAAVPIIPFIFLQKYIALALSVVLVFLVQGFTNAVVALSINVGIFKMAIRASLLALLAAFITFMVGFSFHYFLHISII